jgi:hypothetical protein
MDKDTAAAMTRHLRVLFSAFPNAQRSDEVLAAQTYLSVLDGHSVEAVERSVKQFVTGKVATHDGRFAPSAAELARNVEQWDAAIKVREDRLAAPPLASGILSVDFGHGPIDMTKLTLAEQDQVLRTGRAPQVTIGPATVKIQRMSEQQRGFVTGDKDGHEAAA